MLAHPKIPLHPKLNRVSEAVRISLLVSSGMLAAVAQAQIPCPIYTALNVADAQVNATTCNNYSELNILSPGGVLTNQYLATLTNYPGSALTNNQQLNNYGILNNSGTTNNNSQLLNTRGALNNLSGGSFTNTDVLYSYYGHIDNGGTFINSGTINNLYSGITNRSLGSISNLSGGVINTYGLSISIEKDSTLSNYGQITHTGAIENNGIIVNQSSGVIDMDCCAMLIYGQINNYGTMNITNTTTDSISGTLNNYTGGVFNNNIGSRFFTSNNSLVNNDGVFNNYAAFGNRGTLSNISNGSLTNAAQMYNSDGGEIINDGAFEIAYNGTLYGDGTGMFHQTGGSTIVDGVLSANMTGFTGGTLLGDGEIISANPVLIDVAANVNPGRALADDPVNYIGDLSVSADFHVEGTLSIEIASPASFDLINIRGAASFGNVSNIHFSIVDSYTPQDGDTITFLNADGLTNLEDITFNMTGLPSNLTYEVYANQESDLVLRFNSTSSISDLLDDLQELVDNGTINAGKANGLSSHLYNAMRKLERENTTQSCNQLQAFITVANAMTPNSLDPVIAAELISSAESIQASLGCM